MHFVVIIIVVEAAQAAAAAPHRRGGGLVEEVDLVVLAVARPSDCTVSGHIQRLQKAHTQGLVYVRPAIHSASQRRVVIRGAAAGEVHAAPAAGGEWLQTRRALHFSDSRFGGLPEIVVEFCLRC